MAGQERKEGRLEVAPLRDAERPDLLEERDNLGAPGPQGFFVAGAHHNGKVPPDRQLLLVLDPAAKLPHLFDVLEVLGVHGGKRLGDRSVEVLVLVEPFFRGKADGLPQHEGKAKLVKAPEVHGEGGRRGVLHSYQRDVLTPVDDEVLLARPEQIAAVG